jgi:hypothetical protein
MSIFAGDDEPACDLTVMLRMSIKVANICPFLCDTQQQYQARTASNYSSALQWHLVYLRYLLHVDTCAKTSIEKEIQNALRSRWVCVFALCTVFAKIFISVLKECKQREGEMIESMAKIRSIMKSAGEVAEKQTKLRNGKEALMERGRWIEMDKMLVIKNALEQEGWARMKSLQQRVTCFGLVNMLPVRTVNGHKIR